MNPSDPPEMKDKRRRMVEKLQQRGVICSKPVEDAMLAVPRHMFVLKPYMDAAYDDNPLPILEGQTISAPHMVSIMVEAGQLGEGQNVLEVGAGSGYQAAVMAELVGDTGHIYTIERIDSLSQRAMENLESSGFSKRASVFLGDGSMGLEEHAPYDRIFVTCGAPGVPPPLADQLKEGGLLLIPEGGKRFQTLMEYRKRAGKLVPRKRDGVLFVPMIGEHGF